VNGGGSSDHSDFWTADELRIGGTAWDLEDKGIPYPEKFGEDRRFPFAPMPRVAGTLGAVISK
jgi:hypothetical protein